VRTDLIPLLQITFQMYMVGSKFVISNNVSSYAQFRLTFFFLSSPHGCLHDDDDDDDDDNNDVVLDYREKYNTYNDNMYDAYTNEI